MLYFEYMSDPSSDMNKKYDQLQIYRKNTNSCWLENNTKVLSNDKANINNQKSRKYKDENNRSYLKRFSVFDAGIEGGIQLFDERDSNKQS